MPALTPRPRLVDLFAGAGGLTLGFTEAFGHNFLPVWANDWNDYAAQTYNANFGPHCVAGDIVRIVEEDIDSIPPADVVIGGPPCQGFSLLNKNKDNDPRRHLWRPFFDVVEHCGADVFVMENVPQLLGSTEFNDIRERAESTGFTVRSARLCSADYGVPEIRWRAIIVGCRFADPSGCFPPLKTHFNDRDGYRKQFVEEFDRYTQDPRPWETVSEAIDDLVPPTGTEIRDVPPPYDLHFGRKPTAKSLARYQAISGPGMNRLDLQRLAPELTPECWIRKKSGGTDLFGRLWSDRPAVTIRTEFFKPEKGRYLHPTQHRPITHREAARLQSFPDSFVFRGSKIEIAKQIGNAVPPRMAARIADCVYGLLRCRAT